MVTMKRCHTIDYKTRLKFSDAKMLTILSDTYIQTTEGGSRVPSPQPPLQHGWRAMRRGEDRAIGFMRSEEPRPQGTEGPRPGDHLGRLSAGQQCMKGIRPG